MIAIRFKIFPDSEKSLPSLVAFCIGTCLHLGFETGFGFNFDLDYHPQINDSTSPDSGMVSTTRKVKGSSQCHYKLQVPF